MLKTLASLSSTSLGFPYKSKPSTQLALEPFQRWLPFALPCSALGFSRSSWPRQFALKPSPCQLPPSCPLTNPPQHGSVGQLGMEIEMIGEVSVIRVFELIKLENVKI